MGSRVPKEDSKEYSRNRMESVVSKSSISRYHDLFRRVEDMKAVLENTRQILNMFKTKKIKIDYNFISSIIVGTDVYGITFDREVIKIDIKGFVDDNKNEGKGNQEIVMGSVLEGDKAIKTDENKKNEESGKNNKKVKARYSHYIFKGTDNNQPYGISKQNIDPEKSHTAKINLGVIDKTPIIRITEPRYHYKYGEAHKESEKIIEYFEKNERFKNKDHKISVRFIVTDYKADPKDIIDQESILVCFTIKNDKTKTEYFENLDDFKCTFKFHRITENKLLNTEDRTTALMYINKDKFDRTAFVGTKLGKIWIYDIVNSWRHFLIDSHKDEINQLAFMKNNIIAVSRDKTISKTLMFDIRRIEKFRINKKPQENQQRNDLIEFLMSGLNSEKRNSMRSQYFIYSAKLYEFLKISYKKHDENAPKGRNQKKIKMIPVFPQAEDGYLEIEETEIDESSFKKNNFASFEHISIGKDPELKEFLIFAGNSKNLKVMQIDPKRILKKLDKVDLRNNNPNPNPHHKDKISALSSHNDILISGSADGVIQIWKITEEGTLLFLYKMTSPTGHSLSVTCLRILNKKKIFLSTGYDNTIKIWKFKELIYSNLTNNQQLQTFRETDNDKFIIHTIKNLPSIIRFMVPVDDQNYLITCSAFGYICVWSMKTYSTILVMDLHSSVTFFNEIENHLVYCDGKQFWRFKHNLIDLDRESKEVENKSIDDVLKNEAFLGPDMTNMYQAMKYFRKCIETKGDKLPEFSPIYDKFVILPYFVTSQHIYSFYNMPKHLHQSLYNKTNLSETTFKQNPLSIAISKDFTDCIDTIIKYLHYKLQENPFFINFLSNTSLIEMNFTGRNSLIPFYQTLLIKDNNPDNPPMVGLDLNLPLFQKNPSPVVDYYDLFGSNFLKTKQDSGKSVVFYRSAVGLSLTIGSSRSLDLLRSITECSNQNIFSTPFVKAYIDNKMPVTMPFMFFHGGFYCFYLMLLMIFCTMKEINNGVVGLIFFANLILTIYEFFKFLVLKGNYFLIAWNIIDFIRTIIFIFLIIVNFIVFILGINNLNYEAIRITFFIVTVTSYTRGISFFRLFEGTRYFTYLLLRVISDSVTFMLFMAYNIICVAFMLYISSQYSDNIVIHLENSFLLVYGSWNAEPGQKPIIWFIFVLAMVVNNWMILNFMIAVYSDTFANVRKESEVHNYKTKCEMAFEVESIMFWRRNYVIIQNPDYGRIHNEPEYKERKNIIFRDRSCCKKRNPELKDSQNPNNPQNQPALLKKEDILKEYIHICKSPDDTEEINQELERVDAMHAQSKKIFRNSTNVSKNVASVLAESEKMLKNLRKSSKKITEKSEVADKKLKKEKIKEVTGEILKNAIAMASTHDLNKKSEYKKRISKGILELFDSN